MARAGQEWCPRPSGGCRRDSLALGAATVDRASRTGVRLPLRFDIRKGSPELAVSRHLTTAHPQHPKCRRRFPPPGIRRRARRTRGDPQRSGLPRRSLDFRSSDGVTTRCADTSAGRSTPTTDGRPGAWRPHDPPVAWSSPSPIRGLADRVMAEEPSHTGHRPLYFKSIYFRS